MASNQSSQAATRWVIRIGAVCLLAYFFHPFYYIPKATLPASPAATDSLTLTFRDDAKDGIYQQLTVARDGSHTFVIARAQGDPDVPESGGWRPTMDKATSIITFRKDNVLEPEKAKRIFAAALQAGVLDLQPAPAERGNVLEVSYRMGGREAQVRGPAYVARAYHWFPPRWLNRIRWQNLYLLRLNDAELKRLLSHTEIELVNE
jgi:hypothetical protein